MNVYILHVSHRHGNDYWACASRTKVFEILYQYVVEWWNAECGAHNAIPTDPRKAIDEYFVSTNEVYEIVDRMVC